MGKNEAVLAKAQADVGSVSIAARAVPTGQREPRRTRFMTVLAAIAGGSIGILMALFRDL